MGDGKNKVKNIYDLAGNVIEWTMESYNINTQVYRGGYYNDKSSTYPVSCRGNDLPSAETSNQLRSRISRITIPKLRRKMVTNI